MKYQSQTDLMSLPTYIKFGCEIEVQNVDFEKLENLISQYPELQGWNVTQDASVTDHGAEIVSPPLNENENPNVYANFQKVLDLIKLCPADKYRKVYINEQCGGHIHFDATMMKKNPEMIESYLRLWAEAEELIYKMCNSENNPIRESALKTTPIDGLKRMFFSGISEFLKAGDRIQKDNGNFVKNIGQAVKDGSSKSIYRIITCYRLYYYPPWLCSSSRKSPSKKW